MEITKLEKAKELQSQIEFLKNKIKLFDEKHKWVYLNISDHYGNKWHTIETYAFSNEYLEAAGYSFDNFVADSYGEFLGKVKNKMQERIDILENELLNL
jgi:hypothetical protein